MEIKAHPVSGYLVNRDGSFIQNPDTGYVLNPTKSPTGYMKIGNYICSGGSVHQLVYEAFIGLVPKGMQINHKDGIKDNNDLDNLELVTPRQNTQHAYTTGLASGGKGEDNSMSKVTASDVEQMYQMFRQGSCNSCIGIQFSVHDRYVSLIRSGKRWGHIYVGPFPKSNKWKCSCSSATTIETTE